MSKNQYVKPFGYKSRDFPIRYLGSFPGSLHSCRAYMLMMEL